MSRVKYEYEKADESFIINTDPALTPIRFSLPSPPDYKLIDGYGLPPEEQRFKRNEIPKKLITLYEDTKQQLEDKANRTPSYKTTQYKLQKAFWNRLRVTQEVYKEEIEWLKKSWWHKVYGYWFFNYGKPVYITGWHYSYLNFWQYTETTNSGSKYPDYRDRDRKWFLVNQYAYTTKETFKNIDDDGNALSKDGKYEMEDIGRRTFYGTANTKQRRVGDTHKSLCVGHEICQMEEGAISGIIAENNKASEKQFKNKLIPAWQKYPIFFMPFYDGSYSPSTSIKYQVPGTEVGDVGINSVFDYAESGDGKAYDGQRLVFILPEEEGKTIDYPVLKRWYVLQECLSTGNGMNIHGFSIHPSTVEDIRGQGAVEFKTLMNQSNFYIRSKATGRTISGLIRQFYPACEGLDGFVDSYGYSVLSPLKDYQKKEGFRMGADEYLEKERQQLLATGQTEDIDKYRSLCRKFPLKYADSWIGDYGGIGWNILGIDKRLAEIDLDSAIKPRRGNFVGKPEEGVYFEDDANGRFYVSKIMPPMEANRKRLISLVDIVTGSYKQVYEPEYKTRFTAGADPFKYVKKSERQLISDKSGLSIGGGAVFWSRDKRLDPDTKPSEEWESHRFVCTYLYRATTPEEYGEDMLRMCVYYGAMMYPETNVETLWRYFEFRGFDGYLKYDIDPVTGKYKDRPGIYSMLNSKNDMFTAMGSHINNHIERERHPDLLKQMKDIVAIDDMTSYDLLTAALLAYWGSQSRVNELLEETFSSELDLSNLKNIL